VSGKAEAKAKEKISHALGRPWWFFLDGKIMISTRLGVFWGILQ
jgi:hypothetical protein